MRRVMLLMLMVAILCGASPALSAPAYAIMIDGSGIVSEAKPEIKNGRTMVPIRVISEYLGADIKWSNGTVTLTDYNVQLQLKVNQKTASKNGSPYVLDVKPYLKNNRTYVPLRVIAETFGSKVHYQKGTVHLYSARLIIEGRQVKAIEEAYKYTIGGVEKNITGNPHMTALYNIIRSQTSVEAATPAEYSWRPNQSTEGAYQKLLQFRLLDGQGEEIAQYDIYHSLASGNGSLEQSELRLHHVQADRWYAFSHAARQSIYDSLDRASSQGYVTTISSDLP